jgi:hypothetical protein
MDNPPTTTPPVAALPPVPATPLPAMPPSRLPAARPEPILSKFHLNADEQRILSLANEANQGLARCFDQINRLIATTKVQIEALTPEERSLWAHIDGTPPDDAQAAINALASLLKSFAK